MIGFTTTFRHNYEVEVLEQLPSRAQDRQLYFPGAEPAGGRDGIMVRVTPGDRDGKPWIGIFAFGMIAPRAVSGIFTCPDPDHLCVVARGAGYTALASNPKIHTCVKAEPILGVYAVPYLDLLIFADFERLVAYGQGGFAWKTESLSWDGLRIRDVNGHELQGSGWSAPENRWVEFVVDLRSGAARGGASSVRAERRDS